MSRVDGLRRWRERSYRDLSDTDPPALDFDDPLERVAIAQAAMKWETPDAVASMLDGVRGQEALAKTWASFDAATRQMHRRRAAVLIETVLSGGRRVESAPALSDGYPGGFPSDRLVEGLYAQAERDASA